jgi:ribosomal protein S12 methylthiotransferase
MRTTVIVGFPGETDDDFSTLLEFLEELQFDRVGVFTYSPQEGTRANDMPDDVPQSLKNERQERVQELQRAITGERYERFTGRDAQVMVVSESTEPGVLECRAPWQADDIDGVVRVRVGAGFDINVQAGGAPPTSIPMGTLLDVRVEHVVDDYDFQATLLGIADVPVALAPAVAAARRSRSLPMMNAVSSVGSFGR